MKPVIRLGWLFCLKLVFLTLLGIIQNFNSIRKTFLEIKNILRKKMEDIWEIMQLWSYVHRNFILVLMWEITFWTLKTQFCNILYMRGNWKLVIKYKADKTSQTFNINTFQDASTTLRFHLWTACIAREPSFLLFFFENVCWQ